MITIESVESVSMVSVWMLEPRIPELLLELRKRGYATARVRPRSLGGYDVTFIEPNVVAIKGSTYVAYNPGRRSIAIEGPNPDELLEVLNEVEEVLKYVGSDPVKGVLFYELQAKARAIGSRWVLKKVVKTCDLLGLDLSIVPISFVSVEGDPNSMQWLHLDVKPLWTSWSNEKVRYEVVLVYRDSREKLVNVLKNLDNVLKDVLKRIDSVLESIA